MNESIKELDILLVEDNATDAELCMRALKKHNLANNLVWMKDGAEALDFIFRTGPYAGTPNGVKPRVILLDLRLPKVDGIEVLRRLKSDERTREIPIAVLTSSKEDRDLKECYRLGVNSYIAKPVEFDQFADTIAKLGLYWLVINRVP
ncbi:MAG: response regulator [Acidobacteriia bacterium]|nr:response regulator [Terriglobia bacterium]